MAKYSPDVETAIRKNSLNFGITLGVLSFPFSFFAGALGGWGPLRSFVSILPVLNSGAWAGFLAAIFLDWRKIRPEDALGVGCKVGLRSALVASSLGAVVTLVVSFLTSGGLMATESSSMAEGIAFVAGLGVTNALVLLIGIIPGVLLGILGGVTGAAIRRRTGASPSETPS